MVRQAAFGWLQAEGVQLAEAVGGEERAVAAGADVEQAAECAVEAAGLDEGHGLGGDAHEDAGLPEGRGEAVGVAVVDEPQDVVGCAEAGGVALLAAQAAAALGGPSARALDDSLQWRLPDPCARCKYWFLHKFRCLSEK